MSLRFGGGAPFKDHQTPFARFLQGADCVVTRALLGLLAPLPVVSLLLASGAR